MFRGPRNLNTKGRFSRRLSSLWPECIPATGAGVTKHRFASGFQALHSEIIYWVSQQMNHGLFPGFSELSEGISRCSCHVDCEAHRDAHTGNGASVLPQYGTRVLVFYAGLLIHYLTEAISLFPTCYFSLNSAIVMARSCFPISPLALVLASFSFAPPAPPLRLDEFLLQGASLHLCGGPGSI
jgi:hypothetical protein